MALTVKRLGNVFDRLLDAAVFFAGALVLWQTLSVTVNTALRYIFNSPVTGIENITEYGILWITFLTVAWLLKGNRHIRVDIVTNLLSAKARAVVELVSTLLAIALCVIMFYYSTQVTADLWVTRETDPFKIQGFPKAIPFVIIPFGFLLLIIQYVRKCFSDIERFRCPDQKHSPKDGVTEEDAI